MEKNIFFENLRIIFRDNFRITQLYALYLERFPELITEELVSELTADGFMTKREAVAALLCEIFGLDTEGSADDRRLYRDYILPSVRIMDEKRYLSNPYYKNIRLDNIKKGEWEIVKESYAPYRGVVASDMEIGRDFSEIPPLGFFEQSFSFPAVSEGGNEWMTLTPVDLDTVDEAIAAAHGRVVTFGLGLGYYAYMVSEKAEVESITVVERSREVIELFTTYILPQFSHPEKVNIIEADAYAYMEHQMPKESFDLAFVDIWRDASDGSEAYRRMKPLEGLSPNTKFLYWIENFIISRLRAERFSMLDEKYENGELRMSKEEIIRELTDIDRLIR